MGDLPCFLTEEYARVRARAQHRDAVFFWQVGDFYEAYFDDATTISKILGLDCTARGWVPMAGVPAHSVFRFLGRMVKAGYRVAVCEPSVAPACYGWGDGYEVVRVVSPGLDRTRREAAPLPEEAPADSRLRRLKKMCEEVRRQHDEIEADMREIKKAARKLYEERMGQKWQPSLSVVQGGGKGRKRKAKRSALTLLDGGRG